MSGSNEEKELAVPDSTEKSKYPIIVHISKQPQCNSRLNKLPLVEKKTIIK